MRSTAASAFIGPLIRLLLPLLRVAAAALAKLIAMLVHFIGRAIAWLFKKIADLFRKIIDWFQRRGGPSKPIYERGGRLPHARELIKRGKEWEGTGRGGGKLPVRNTPNSVLYRRDPATGKVTSYSVYDESGLIIKRVDLTGRSHGGVPTPHVVEYRINVNPRTGETYPAPSGKLPRPTSPGEEP
ncbi:MAG: polymorphic toxin type 24 domain-containing protein [Pseudonocardiaceae bacterium]